jgi:subtilisin family serine protease
MNYNDSTLIVGLHTGAPKQIAINAISLLHGFIAILYQYKYVYALLLKVDPNELENFITDVVKLEYVDYCERNFISEPAAFEDIIEPSLMPKYCSSSQIRKLHKIDFNPFAGFGASISIIDSGISPHPYLPSLTFSEMIERFEKEPKHITPQNIQNELGILKDIEKDTNRNPFSNSSAISNYLTESELAMDKFYGKVYSDWSDEADEWYDEYKSSASSKPRSPSMPIFKKSLSSCRKISRKSYNFIDDDLNIIDFHGHGTQVAGIIASRPNNISKYLNTCITDKMDYFEIDALGISPCSELVILKAYEENNTDESTIHNIIRALEYSIDKQVDVVYIGLTFEDIPSSPILGSTCIALNTAIEKCKKKDIPVICPAGNDGQEGLRFPAACKSAWSISSITLTNNDYRRPSFSSHSNWANKTQKIDFAAFGGDPDCHAITTSLKFGYEYVKGTSVAAAIATGIIALRISDDYISQAKSQYDKFLNNALYIDNQKPSKLLPIDYDIKRPDLISLYIEITNKCNKYLKQITPSDPKVGNGIIRKI